MSPAISIRSVSKRFRLQHERYNSLKERIIKVGKKSYDDLWALDDVSFDIEEGSTYGLMGHNGSGKSTLLKLVGGILQPTSGEIVTKGRIAALLELGAGMQQDLTGRETNFGVRKKKTVMFNITRPDHYFLEGLMRKRDLEK